MFEKTWDIFKSRIGTLVSLYLLCMILFFIPIGIFVGIGFIFSQAAPDFRIPMVVAGAVVGSIAGIIAGTWGFGSFIYAVTDKTSG